MTKVELNPPLPMPDFVDETKEIVKSLKEALENPDFNEFINIYNTVKNEAYISRYVTELDKLIAEYEAIKVETPVAETPVAETPAKEPAPDFKLTQNTLDDLQNELKQKLEDQLNKVYTTAQVPPEPEQPPVSEPPVSEPVPAPAPEPEPEPEPSEQPAEPPVKPPVPAEPEQNTYDEDARKFYNRWVQLYGTDIKPIQCVKKSFGKNTCTITKTTIDKNIAISYINPKLKTPLNYIDNNDFWNDAQKMYENGEKQYEDPNYKPTQMDTQKLLEIATSIRLQKGQDKLKKFGNTVEKVGKKVGKKVGETHNKLANESTAYRTTTQAAKVTAAAAATSALAAAEIAAAVTVAGVRGAQGF